MQQDVINPLVSQFVSKITGAGYGFFTSASITRLNDFVNYLCAIAPDEQFAFYPLRKDQNLGKENVAFGIGKMVNETGIIFQSNANWTSTGVIFNSKNNCGIIDFKPFQFRLEESSIFYFAKHTETPNPEILYGGDNKQFGYFCVDDSADYFSVNVAEYSNSRVRSPGTTYIEDEIYGIDKRSIQIDWSEKDTEKYWYPTSFSFYQIDKNIPRKQVPCIYVGTKFNQYYMRIFDGKDPKWMSGQFLDTYNKEVIDQNVFKYRFPTRLIAGAVVSNRSLDRYDTDPVPHLCPGILIMKGIQFDKAEEIFVNMARSIGIILTDTPETFDGSDNSEIYPELKNLNYIYAPPYDVGPYQDFSTFRTQINSVYWEDVYKINIDNIQGGKHARLPRENTFFNPTVGDATGASFLAAMQNTGILYKTGIKEYFAEELKGPNGKPIYGFVSGYIDNNGSFQTFGHDSLSGSSGFYLKDIFGNNTGIFNFPPFAILAKQNITGFINGEIDNLNNFTPYNAESNLYGSGYYIDDFEFNFPEIIIENHYITGFLSGILDNFGAFYPYTGISKSSGYIYNDEYIKFPPFATTTGFEKIIGFINGILSGGIFIQDTGNPQSGFFYQAEQYQFPTGEYEEFLGFSGILNEDIGFDYTGFSFPEGSGFSGIVQDQIVDVNFGIMTGYIGTANILIGTGTFSGIQNYTGIDYGIGNTFSGYFVVSSGFVPEPNLFNSNENFGQGIMTGIIGSYRKIAKYPLTSFFGRFGFNDEYGYRFDGFNFGAEKQFVPSAPGSQDGKLTGYIGYRNIKIISGEFNNFLNTSIDQTIAQNLTVTLRETGFIYENNNIGKLTGIVASGTIMGDLSKISTDIGVTGSGFVNPIMKTTGLYYLTGVIEATGVKSSFDSVIPGYSGWYPNFVLYQDEYFTVSDDTYVNFASIGPTGSGISGMITGIRYRNGIVSGDHPSGYFTPSGYAPGSWSGESGNIYTYFGLNRFTGILSGVDIGSGTGFIISGVFQTTGVMTGTGFLYKTGIRIVNTNNLSGSIVSGAYSGFTGDMSQVDVSIYNLDYFYGLEMIEIYPYKDLVSGITSFEASISSILYEPYTAPYTISNNTELETEINNITSISYIAEYNQEESGNYSIAPIGKISVIPTQNIYDSGIDYKISGITLTDTGFIDLLADKVILLLRMNSTGDGNFIDSSVFANTITKNGDVKYNFQNKKYGNSSTYFDGNNDFLFASNLAEFNLTNSGFCAELWCLPTGTENAAPLAPSTGIGVLLTSAAPIDTRGFSLGIDFNDNIGWLIGTGNGWLYSNKPSQIQRSGWSHIAIIRNINNLLLYLSGQLIDIYSFSGNENLFPLSNNRFQVGGATLNSSFYNGFIDDVRITKNTNRYLNSLNEILPPQVPLYFTDQYYNETVLLLNFELNVSRYDISTKAQLENQNNIRDFSKYNNSIGLSTTNTADLRLNTDYYKFLGSSLFLKSGQFIQIDNSGNYFSFGTGDFGIETWISPSGLSGIQNNNITIFCAGTQNNTYRGGGWDLNLYKNNNINKTYLNFNYYHTGNNSGISADPFIYDEYFDNTWLLLGTGEIGSTGFAINSNNYNAINNNITGYLLSSSPSFLPKISNQNMLFGNNSIEFFGSGGFLACSSGNFYEIGNNDFTIEMWFSPNSGMIDRGLFQKQLAGAAFSSNPAYYSLYVNSARQLVFEIPITYSPYQIASSALTLSSGQWYHVAVARNKNITRMFFNGNSVGTPLIQNYNIASGGVFRIGTAIGGSDASRLFYSFTGHISNFRFTNGICRYDSNFNTGIFAQYPPSGGSAPTGYTISYTEETPFQIEDMYDKWNYISINRESGILKPYFNEYKLKESSIFSGVNINVHTGRSLLIGAGRSRVGSFLSQFTGADKYNNTISIDSLRITREKSRSLSGINIQTIQESGFSINKDDNFNYAKTYLSFDNNLYGDLVVYDELNKDTDHSIYKNLSADFKNKEFVEIRTHEPLDINNNSFTLDTWLLPYYQNSIYPKIFDANNMFLGIEKTNSGDYFNFEYWPTNSGNITLYLSIYSGNSGFEFNDISKNKFKVNAYTGISGSSVRISSGVFPNTHSAYFSGGSYLEINKENTNCPIDFDLNCFTFEAWIYWQSGRGISPILCQPINGSGPIIGLDASSWGNAVFTGHWFISYSTSSTTSLISSPTFLGRTPPKNKWVHLALVTNQYDQFGMGTKKTYAFIDGKLVSGNIVIPTNFVNTEETIIGMSYAIGNNKQAQGAGTSHFQGNIQNLTFTSGYAKYIKKDIPKTGFAQYTDPEFNNVALLIPMTGTNLSSGFQDLSNNQAQIRMITGSAFNNNVYNYIVTGESLFYDSAFYSRRTANSIAIENKNNLFDFNTGDFTIEIWLKQPYIDNSNIEWSQNRIFQSSMVRGLTGAGIIIRNWSYSNPQEVSSTLERRSQPIVAQFSTLHNQYRVLSLGDNSYDWNHFAVARKNDHIYTFKNGLIMDSAYIGTGAIYYDPLTQSGFMMGVTGLHGDISSPFIFANDLRITKNVCRYNPEFEPARPEFIKLQSDNSIQTGKWANIAITNNSGQYNMFVDGKKQNSSGYLNEYGSVDAQFFRVQNQPFEIGNSRLYYENNIQHFNGRIQDFRITKNIARYSGDYEVSSSTYPFVQEKINTLYDPYFDNVSILLSCIGNHGSTGIIDRSKNKFLPKINSTTSTGSLALTTGTKNLNNASIYFNTLSNSSIQLPNSQNFNFSNGIDFTIEGYFYPSGGENGINATLCATYRDGGGGGNFRFRTTAASRSFQIDTAATLYCEFGGCNSQVILSTPANSYNMNVWNHFALTRKNNKYFIFSNGKLLAETSNNSKYLNYNLIQQPIYIGAAPGIAGGAGGSMQFAGFLDEFRITRGVARYTNNFEVPNVIFPTTGELNISSQDPYIKNVSLYIPFTGTQVTKNITDQSAFKYSNNNVSGNMLINNLPTTFFAIGNAKTSNNQYKTDYYSAYIGNSGSYFYMPFDYTGYEFKNNDFTIESWIYLNSGTGNYRYVFGNQPSHENTNSGSYALRLNSGYKLEFVTDNILESVINVKTGEWSHVAVNRNQNILNIFINGQCVATGNYPNNFNNFGHLTIGSFGESGIYTNHSLDGYIDEFKISNGSGIYKENTNFVPKNNLEPYDINEISANTKFLISITGSN